jgi:enoyl-CoA hydratase
MNVKITKQDAVLVLTINRPKALNALNLETLEALKAGLKQAQTDHDVRVIVITGEGDKSFVAGADIKGFTAITDPAQGEAFAREGQAIFSMLAEIPKPVIAAVNGYALGGGCELAMACDIRFASEKARFGLPEVTLGILPGYGGTQRLPRLIGKGMALYMAMSGEMISAEEAKQLGLVEKVFAPEALMEETFNFAKKLINLPPLSLAAIKESVHKGTDQTLEEGLALEAQQFGKLIITKDAKEGVAAFIEKRPAKFTGQ